MPFPNQPTQFQPGQSGNPAGHSKGRRITSALEGLIDEIKADPKLARVWLAKALGDRRLLKMKDGPDLDPDFRWFAMLVERLEGKVAIKLETKSGPSKQLEWEDNDGDDDQDAEAPPGAEPGEEAPGAI